MVKRARLQRQQRRSQNHLRNVSKSDEELPREYQIMLFWAGLRGAVGFALSAGIEGQNAEALQTTVLVAVVLTVIAFGGTTAQMLEILGIRTGVEDDEGDSTDEEEEAEIASMRLRSIRNKRRLSALASANHGGSHASTSEAHSLFYDEEEGISSRRDSSRGTRSQLNWASGGSYADADDDGNGSLSSTDVLPSKSHSTENIYGPPSTSEGGEGGNDSAPLSSEVAVAPEDEHHIRRFLDRAGLIMRDGRWFSTLDRRYLTPLFTNSVASRKYEERKAMRRSEAALASAMGVAGETHVPFSGDAADPGTLGPLGPLTEQDADQGDEGDDEDDFVRRLDTDIPSGSSSGHSVGAHTPVRRPISRNASRDGNEEAGIESNEGSGHTGSSSSRITGAFAPTSWNAGGHASRLP